MTELPGDNNSDVNLIAREEPMTEELARALLDRYTRIVYDGGLGRPLPPEERAARGTECTLLRCVILAMMLHKSPMPQQQAAEP